MNHEISYGVEEFLEEYQGSAFEKKAVRDFMETVKKRKVGKKEAKGAVVLIQLAIEMFVEKEEA